MSLFKKLFKKEDHKKGDFYAVTIDRIIRRTDKVVSLQFNRPLDDGTFDFKPGQYLTFKANINGKEVRRDYSLNSLPTDPFLEVTVKEMPEGYFSKYINQTLTEGDTLEIMAPTGNFTLNDNPAHNHQIAFAGGSGITPIFSMIKHIIAHNNNDRVTLFYANRTVNDIIFKYQLDDLAKSHNTFKPIHIISDEAHSLSEYSGFIDAEKVALFKKKYFPELENACFYLCGPGPMVENIKDALLALGVEQPSIKTELFTAAPTNELTTSGNAEGSIVEKASFKIKYSYNVHEIEFKDPKKSVLDTVLDAGINVPFSCLNGVCSTCSAKLLKGSVKMDQNFALDEADLAAGYILTCQSHPTSNELEIDYDDSLV